MFFLVVYLLLDTEMMTKLDYAYHWYLGWLANFNFCETDLEKSEQGLLAPLVFSLCFETLATGLDLL